MAQNWTPVYTHADVQILSAQSAIDVQTVGVRTLPSQIFFEYQLATPKWLGWQDPATRAALDPIANELEGYLFSPRWEPGAITDAIYVQDIDASGLITAYMDFTASWPAPADDRPGPFTTVARVPFKLAVGGGYVVDQVNAILDKAFGALEATAES